jgi:hypothetical protein
MKDFIKTPSRTGLIQLQDMSFRGTLNSMVEN